MDAIDADTLESVRRLWIAAGPVVVDDADGADGDTVDAIRGLWIANVVLPALFEKPIESGRLKPPQPLPYAHVHVEQGPRPNERMTGGIRHDFRKVTITVYGTKPQVVPAMKAILAIFNEETTLVYPSGARFIRWWPLNDGRLEQKQIDQAFGQDVWRGILEAEAWSVRLT